MTTIRCIKRFCDIPIAHRQWSHQGHCAFIHGHNLCLELEFASQNLDKHGFVIDFGKLKNISEWITKHLDHAMLFAHDDPHREPLVSAAKEAWKIYLVKDTSMEGLAKHLFDKFQQHTHTLTKGRAWLESLSIEEDSKNRVWYKKENDRE